MLLRDATGALPSWSNDIRHWNGSAWQCEVRAVVVVHVTVVPPLGREMVPVLSVPCRRDFTPVRARIVVTMSAP